MAAIMPLVFVVLWSTGFIGARLGLPYSEAMTFLALRFCTVAVVLAACMMAMGTRWPTWAQWREQALIGVLVHVCYLGGVFVAIDMGMEAGLAAVIVGLQPLAIAFVAAIMLGERLSWLQWSGMALGLGGTMLIVARKLGAGVGDPVSLAFAVAALAGISLGSVLQKRARGLPMLAGNMAQFTVSGLVCGAGAFLFETREIEWTPAFMIALGWSIAVLSFVALTLYYMLIQRGEASRVASLFFLVPPCTALVALFLFDERLGPVEMAGMAAAAVGVLIVLRKPVARGA